eukprot:221838_1
MKHSRRKPFKSFQKTKATLFNDRNNILFLCGYLRIEQNQNKCTFPPSAHYLIRLYATKSLVFGIGGNKNGALGVGHKRGLPQWTLLRELSHLATNISNIYKNGTSLFVIAANDDIFACGSNRSAQLQMGTPTTNTMIGPSAFNKYKESPIETPFVSRFTSIHKRGSVVSSGTSNSHTFIIDGSKQISSSGKAEGQVGVEIAPYITKFIKETIKDIKCAQNHSLFLTKNGNLYIVGKHSKPRKYRFPHLLFHGVIGIDVGDSHSIILNKYHQITLLGRKQNTVLRAKYFTENNIKINIVKCGKKHSLCVSTKGECFTFGNNNYGQIGNDKCNEKHVIEPYKVKLSTILDTDDYVIAADCGYDHNVLMSKKNKIICFGHNQFQQCSVAQDTIISTPRVVSMQKQIDIQNAEFIIDGIVAFGYNTLICVNPNNPNDDEIQVNNIKLQEKVRLSRGGSKRRWRKKYQNQRDDTNYRYKRQSRRGRRG